MSWANRYIGIPFNWQGASFDGCSCWGLMQLVGWERFGWNLPGHADLGRAVETGDRVFPEPYMKGFEPIPLVDVREGDLLHLWMIHRGRKLPLHVGMVVAPYKVLHIEDGCGSVIVDYRKQPMSRRIIGAYRYA